MNKFIVLLLMSMMIVGCASKKQEMTAEEKTLPEFSGPESKRIVGGHDDRAYALPHIIVYRMSGDYANLVPVRLDDSGTRLISYPAPSDIRPEMKPELLVDGWYLDHRGVDYHTAFTSYTYEEYHNLRHTPSHEELMKSIIVKRGITEIKDLGTKELSREEIIQLLK